MGGGTVLTRVRASVRRLDDESGVTLIEVLVAFTILGIVMAGLVATTINALNLSRNNANRVVAANIASGEIERLRSLPFATLDDAPDGETEGPDYLGVHQRQVTVDRQDFTLTRTIEWSTLEAEDGVCSETVGPGDENVLAVTVDVSWTRMLGVRPVRNETTISPPIGAYSPNTGTLAIQVVDDSVTPQEGIADALVTVTGPDPGTSNVGGTPALTDADGCVVLTGMSSGTYTVEVEKMNYLDLSGNRPTVNHPVTVQVRARTDHRVELYPTGYIGVELQARSGDFAPTGLPRYATPADGPTVPVGEYDDATDTWSFSDSARREVAAGSYTVSAGICDLGGYTSSSYTVDPGPEPTATVGQAQLASVDVDWVDGTVVTTDPFELTATWQGECAGGDETQVALGTITPGEPVSVALPWTGEAGSWRFQAVNPSTNQVVNGVDGDPDGDATPSLVQGGLGDWVNDINAVPTVYLALPLEGCDPTFPTVVGSEQAAFPSNATTSTTQSVAVPDGTASGDVQVFSVVSSEVDASNWAPSGSDWQLVADNSLVAVWTREVSGVGSTVQFHRPQYSFFWWSWSRRGSVHLTTLRGVTDPVPSLSQSIVASVGVNDLTFPSWNVPADERALLYHAIGLEGNRGVGAFTSGTPNLHNVFADGGGQTHVNYWQQFGLGPVETGPTTVSWSGGSVPASGHQLLFEATCG